jgi:hypothetical protein
VSRPPETPPPTPAELYETGQLARLAYETGNQLHLLIVRMDALNWQPDGYDRAKLRHVADSIKGMALRCAMSANDIPLLNELTGRTWTPLHGDPTEGDPQ